MTITLNELLNAFMGAFGQTIEQPVKDESLIDTKKVSKFSSIPRYIEITETGDYANVVRVLDTTMFKPKKSKKLCSIKNNRISRIDSNYDKLIKEFNLNED